MKFFSVLLFVFAILVPSAQAAGQDCSANDPRCEWFKHGPKSIRKPPVPNMVCFDFVQYQPGEVVLTLYDRYVNEKDNHVLRQLKDNKKTHDRFCVGPQWVRKSVFADLCDFIHHSDRERATLQQGLRTGIVTMCLYGDRNCSKFQY